MTTTYTSITDLLAHTRNPDLSFDRSLLPVAARQAKKVLLAMATDWNLEVRDLIPGVAQDQEHDVMALMFALSLSSPSPELKVIVDAYYDEIVKTPLKILKLNELFAKHDFGDVRSMVKCIDPKHVRIMLQAVRTSSKALLLDAVAHDDSHAFRIANNFEDLNQAYHALAAFPIDTQSEVYRDFVKTKKDHQEVFFRKVMHLWSGVRTVFTNGSKHQRVDPGAPPSLLAGHHYLKPAVNGSEPPIYLEPGFGQSMKDDAKRCIEFFFGLSPGTRCQSPEGWKHIDGITQATLDAGVPAQEILTIGFFKRAAAEPLADLKPILDEVSMMTPENLRYYQVALQAYFKEFDAQTLLDHCDNLKTQQQLYTVTLDKTLLRLGGGGLKDAIFAGDLGL